MTYSSWMTWPPIEIRNYASKDADSLCRIFFDAVRGIGVRDYSEAQVGAWAPRVMDSAEFVERVSDGRVVLVAVDQKDCPIAYGELELDGHIDHLYCQPEVQGTGIASALFDRLERKAYELDISRLFVEASEAARRLFLKKGFVEMERREFLLRGVLLHHYRMEKRLQERGSAR